MCKSRDPFFSFFGFFFFIHDIQAVSLELAELAISLTQIFFISLQEKDGNFPRLLCTALCLTAIASDSNTVTWKTVTHFILLYFFRKEENFISVTFTRTGN